MPNHTPGRRMGCRRRTAALWAAAALACAASAPGQEPAAAEPAAGAATNGVPGSIDVRADKLTYDRDDAWVEGIGNVVVRRGDEELRADKVRVYMDTEDAYAIGNVTLRRGEEVWQGSRLHYRFGKERRTARFDDVTGMSDPFRVLRMERADMVSSNHYVFRKARVTTCECDPPHYHVRARNMHVKPGHSVRAAGASWFFGPVPVLYLPYWYRSVRDRWGIRMLPGHNSRKGDYLLTTLWYKLTDRFKGFTHADYYEERGVGVGQEFEWWDGDRYRGDILGYFIDDDEPIDDDEDPASADIEQERYRFRLRHAHSLSPQDYLLLNADYLSDTDVVEDFFEEDYRDSREPENYFSLTHVGDQYAVNFLASGRLNDFYDEVNRAELSIEFLRQPVGPSMLYYEGRTEAAHLERVFEESNLTAEDYGAFRFDTLHTFYRPSRHFGFLNLIPRAGYRGTYYSKTRETETRTELVPVMGTNVAPDGTEQVVQIGLGTNEVPYDVEKDADYRSLFELGMEISFKAFSTWDSAAGPRRHIVEPYADYTFVPEPTLLPENIYQFDRADRLDEEHTVLFGVRNKLQKKRNQHPFDVLDVDVHTEYNLDAGPEEDEIREVDMDVEYRYDDALQIDADGSYNVPDSEMDEFNIRLGLSVPLYLGFSTEYRYRREDSSQLAGEVTLFPERRWTLEAFGRYEFEESRTEEVGGAVQHTWDCMALRLTGSTLPGYTRTDGTEREDELRFMLEFWLTAFPDSGIRGRHRER